MSVYDVSQWQPISRIKELAESGNCQGVILKLGEPNDEYDDQLDPHFEEFLEEARKYNIPVGIYYMSRARDMHDLMREAEFINICVYNYFRGVEPELGTWIDLERKEVMRDDIQPQVLDMIGTMQAWWNNSNKIGIYGSSLALFKQYFDMNDLVYYDIPLWVAQYGESQPTPNGNWDTWVGWQYTDEGEIPGISTYVDQDQYTDGILLDDTSPIPNPGGNTPPAEETTTIIIQCGDTLIIGPIQGKKFWTLKTVHGLFWH